LNIILAHDSNVEDSLELEEIKEAVADMHRYKGENPSGSYTFIGATEDEPSKVVTVTARKKERVWVVLDAHEATDEEREKWEEVERRSG
jgi:hypothetical protein